MGSAKRNAGNVRMHTNVIGIKQTVNEQNRSSGIICESGEMALIVKDDQSYIKSSEDITINRRKPSAQRGKRIE
jgi:hypothetical protein